MVNPYQRLADKLDSLPNGFPATKDQAELRLLAKLFSYKEAEVASFLMETWEPATVVAKRCGKQVSEVNRILKDLARRGLIRCSRLERSLGFCLMPFVVGFYENQGDTIDFELAKLFEEYYRQSAKLMLSLTPQVHRVVPVNEAIRNDMEIRPYESAIAILDHANAWGVVDCICRKQRTLVGEPCSHPIDNCMVLSPIEQAFDHHPTVRALTREEAQEKLFQAAKSGLVHSVNNSREDVWYICNCCTCSCGILRALKEMGISNVVARSAFINVANEELCIGCGSCESSCQFDAISVNSVAKVDRLRCVGCGICVVACQEDALTLERRPASEIEIPPASETEWKSERLKMRGLV